MKTTLRRVLNRVFTFWTLINMVSASRRSPQGLLKIPTTVSARESQKPGDAEAEHHFDAEAKAAGQHDPQNDALLAELMEEVAQLKAKVTDDDARTHTADTDDRTTGLDTALRGPFASSGQGREDGGAPSHDFGGSAWAAGGEGSSAGASTHQPLASALLLRPCSSMAS